MAPKSLREAIIIAICCSPLSTIRDDLEDRLKDFFYAEVDRFLEANLDFSDEKLLKDFLDRVFRGNI